MGIVNQLITRGHYLVWVSQKILVNHHSLWIQLYLLRKYIWGMMTMRRLVPSQTVAMDP